MDTLDSSAERDDAFCRKLQSRFLIWIAFEFGATPLLETALPNYLSVDHGGQRYAGVLLKLPRRHRAWMVENIRRECGGTFAAPPLSPAELAERGRVCGYRGRPYGWRYLHAEDMFHPALWPLTGPRARVYIGYPIEGLELVRRASHRRDPLWLREAWRFCNSSPRDWLATIRRQANLAERAVRIDTLIRGAAR